MTTIDRSIIIVSVLAVIFACTLIALLAQVPSSSWLEGRLWSAAWTRAARSARRLGGGRETR